MQINEIMAKSILQKSGIPGISYVINPYVGCAHSCVYCYARFMKKFTGHTEAWGSFLDAKVNSVEVLKRQLSTRKEPIKETILLSSVTDPYTPFESRYKLTRGILEVLLEHQAPISILTKSDTVLRDIDLLKQFNNCTVGLSLMTTADEISLRFEPRATKASARIRALGKLSESGLATYCFISPYLPDLSDINEIIAAISGLVDEVGVEAFNTRGANWSGVCSVLNKFYPELAPGYFQVVKDESYWDVIEEQARHLAEKLNISFMGFFRH